MATGLNALHIHVPISVQLFLMSDHLHLAIHLGAIVRAILLITVDHRGGGAVSVAARGAAEPGDRDAALRMNEVCTSRNDNHTVLNCH